VDWNDDMRKSSYITASAVLSVLLHLFLLAFADRIRLAAFTSVPTEPAQKPPTMRLHSVDLRDRVMNRPTPRADAEQVKQELREITRRTDAVQKIFEANKLTGEAPPQVRLAGLGRSLLAPKQPEPTPGRVATAPRPTILAIDASKLSPERLALNRQFIPNVPRQNTDKMLPSLVASGDLQNALGKSYDVGMRLSLPGFKPLPPGELPPGADGGDGTAGREGLGPRNGAKLSGLEDGRFQGIDQMDALMAVRLTVFEERDGSGVFRVDISPNPRSERLQSIPKDVVFVIDCSTSISPQKLEQFQVGAVEAFASLQPQDRFNVVSFRDEPNVLFDKPVPVDKTHLDKAVQYVQALVRDGMTDVFAGVAPSVTGQTGDEARPLLIYLMTDGKSTVRESLANDALIRKIVELNKGDVSIYAFSAGRSANLQLLDFLAYHNRGASLHKEKLAEFRGNMVGFVAGHSDLIVRDVRYHVTGDLAAEIFPKTLPHLYRGETLSVYGRYPSGTQEIALQVYGRDAEGKLEELVFRGSVLDAPRASPQLALDWAAQKVFHLIGERTLKPAPEIDVQIRQVAERYNLFIPY